jgi:hypothetical protein
MFSFLTRLGRLAIAIPVIALVATILGFGALNASLVSHHQSTASASCTISSGGVGQPLTTTGRAFGANTQYVLYATTPAGTGATTATTDGSGSFTVNSWAYWKGTYSAAVWSAGGGAKLVANCSSVTLS